MITHHQLYLFRIAVIAVIIAAAGALNAADFSKYTVISSAQKNALRANWQSKFGASGFTPGNVAVFGNSITYTNAFWRPFAYGTPGIVPGTNLASYTIEKGPASCAYSGYQIGDGLSCVVAASASLKPEVVICEYGTNDIRDKNIGTFGADYARYLDTVLARGVIPVISTIPPMRMNGDASFDAVCNAINDTIRALAQRKNVVLVDYYRAMMDCSNNNPFSGTWMDADGVHPAGGCTLTDTANPQCGYGVRNAVCWHAVNKVYRIIIENGTADDGGRDSIPPAAVTGLTATGGPWSGCVTLAWTAPGNDGTIGTAASYEIRCSETAIIAANFSAATAVQTAPRPLPAGSAQTCVASGLTPGKTYFFALVTSDGPNRSGLSNVASARADSGTPYLSDSAVLTPIADTYLESGSDAGSSWGDKPFLRIKSGGQGMPLLKFSASAISFTPDSGVLLLTVAPDMPADADYSYRADVCGVTATWDESTASYNNPRTGAAWPNSSPQSSFDRTAGAAVAVSFSGAKSDRNVHVFPLSGTVARGLVTGTYTSVGIYETGSAYNNVHFSSREGTTPPSLVLYKRSGAMTMAGTRRAISGTVSIRVIRGDRGCLLLEITGTRSGPGWKARVFTVDGKTCRALLPVTTRVGDPVRFRWNGEGSAPGTYLVGIENGRFSAVRKVTVW